MKKVKLLTICLTLLIFICGCNNVNDNSESNTEPPKQELTQEEKNELFYTKAKSFYENKEYAYASEYFNYIKGYKDVNNILSKDKYFKLSSNRYTGTTTSYSITFEFTSYNTLLISYATHYGGDGLNGAYKIVNNRIYLEEGYETHIYKETDWYITNVKDNSIVVKFKNTNYTLYKE